MRNKLVINIIIAYFVVLCIVFFVQLNDTENNEESYNQTVEVSVSKPDKMRDSVALKVGSSSGLLNDKLFSIDPKDETIITKVINNEVFVPADVFSNVFKGEVSWNEELKELVLRYNNKAVILKEKDREMKVIDNIDENEKIIQNSIMIVDDNVYVPLRDVAEEFGKNVFFDGDIVILSDGETVFDSKNDKGLIGELLERLKLRNVYAFKNNNETVYFNSKLISIDENNNEIVPVSENGINYIPVKMISSVFGGETVWNSERKEITIKYNQREAVFSSKSDNVYVDTNNKKDHFIMPDAFKILNEYSYLSLDSFADVFGKNIFIDGDCIIISGKDNTFDKEKDNDIIMKITQSIK